MAAKSKQPSRGETTRHHILKRSASVFNQHGYAGTSMSDLMAATGLEKGGIYRHFRSKEELAAAAFDYAWDTVTEPRWRGLDDCSSAIDKLRLLTRNFIDLPGRLPGGCPLLNTAIDSDDGNPVLRDKARMALSQWRAALIEIVCRGQRAGELRTDIHPETIAVVMISGLEGAVMMSRLEKTREPLKLIAEHLDTYLQSLRIKTA